MARRQQMTEESGIFTREHYNILINERRTLNDLIGKLEKAEQCGIDCAMFRQMRSDIDSQLAAIQQHFMTPPPQ